MESIRVRRRRPRSKRDVLTTGGQSDYYVDPADFGKLVSLLNQCPKNQMKPLLLALLTRKELADITRRILMSEMVLNGSTYDEIARKMGSGKNTVALVKESLSSHERILARLLDPAHGQRDITESYFMNRLKRGR